jgi:hypothetical protein
MQQSQWPAAVVAVAFIAFVAAIFLVVYNRDGVDAAVKAWGAIGTIVGVVTGAIPSFFFHQTAKAAQQNATVAQHAAMVAQRNTNALLAVTDPAVVNQARQHGFRLAAD